MPRAWGRRQRSRALRTQMVTSALISLIHMRGPHDVFPVFREIRHKGKGEGERGMNAVGNGTLWERAFLVRQSSTRVPTHVVDTCCHPAMASVLSELALLLVLLACGAIPTESASPNRNRPANPCERGHRQNRPLSTKTGLPQGGFAHREFVWKTPLHSFRGFGSGIRLPLAVVDPVVVFSFLSSSLVKFSFSR